MLDRRVLVSNLLAGALGFLITFPISWWVLPVGAVYVVAVSVFFAAVYARPELTLRQEAWTWLGPWLLAIVLWTLIWVSAWFESSVSHYLGGLALGLVLGTATYVAWQLLALVIRELMAWRSGTPSTWHSPLSS